MGSSYTYSRLRIALRYFSTMVPKIPYPRVFIFHPLVPWPMCSCGNLGDHPFNSNLQPLTAWKITTWRKQRVFIQSVSIWGYIRSELSNPRVHPRLHMNRSLTPHLCYILGFGKNVCQANIQIIQTNGSLESVSPSTPRLLSGPLAHCFSTHLYFSVHSYCNYT